ncbi:hypothetical protein KIN20_011233 [Parelaphostrongylus tenuis]|uniref:Uncharacterized protein n=1 Tax=Parelaphostrongylus tenuis TaxID=148309 RepID=A0AAD5MUP3_PARTN|nr:hypothetical protein KIN20_011233 [Parelaphostrongylus tenuis]
MADEKVDATCSLKDHKLSTDLPVSFTPSFAAFSGSMVAVGGQEAKVFVDARRVSLCAKTAL